MPCVQLAEPARIPVLLHRALAEVIVVLSGVDPEMRTVAADMDLEATPDAVKKPVLGLR